MPLSKLPGKTGENHDCEFFSNVTVGLNFIEKKQCCVSSGEYGSVTLYVDDCGKYRGLFHYRMMERSMIITDDIKIYKQWIKKYMKIQNGKQ